jgi:hypothetical protein
VCIRGREGGVEERSSLCSGMLMSVTENVLNIILPLKPKKSPGEADIKVAHWFEFLSEAEFTVLV